MGCLRPSLRASVWFPSDSLEQAGLRWSGELQSREKSRVAK